MTDKTTLPEYVAEKLQEISHRFSVPFEEVQRQYMEIFNSDFVQTDPQFRSDDDRHAYSIRVLWVRYAAQPPTREYVVIPFGIVEPRVARTSGIKTSRIYVVAQEGEEFKPKVIICRGETLSELVNQVELFHAYKVQLSTSGNLLFATTLTKFTDPRPIPTEPLKFLTRVVGAKVIKISETPIYPTETDDKGYINEFDFRIIKGIVLRYNYGTRPDGSKWAVYTIADDSVGAESITDSGVVVPSQFTVWVPFRFLRYDVDSELAFIGHVRIGNNEPFMNAICAIPIHARPLEI
ncbi:MAG TPA: hypothetical protein ENF41_00340 [Candidatus Bathyarchaeota archaeon]|nr:hypothetical protein [Candidatus Bathyarchaeota archaeon]